MKGLAKRFVSHKGEAYAVDIPKKKKVDDSIGFFGLWRYATITERLITIIAVTVSWCCAGGLVLAVALYGELTALFVSRHTAVRAEAAVILGCFGGGRILPPGNRTLHMDALVEDSMAFLWASIAVMAIQLTTAAVAVGLANWAAHRMVNRLRWRLLRAVLGQEMAFFDTNTSLDIVATLTEDMEKLRSGVGEHVSMTSYLAGTVALCLCTALHAGWLLTLAAVAVVPVAAGTAAVVSKYQTRCAEEESQAYGVAARVVEEALAGVRTVRAYGGEEGEVERYSSLLTPARAAAGRRGRWAGAGAGAGWLLTYALNAVVFALGARLVARDLLLPPEEQEYNPRVLVTILFTTFMAAQNIAMCQPHLEVFTQARAAARSAYRLLERKPTIDVDAADSGAERVRPDKFKGDITFENIYFNYPARPDVKVLRGLTLNIQSGTTVAFVGSSGCGKSTLLQLLQRLYEPDHGRITVDGHPLRNIDLKYFRQSIGVVGQEPVLFSGTILDNITLGMAHVSQDAVEKAATMANAHEFISKLPDGYNTLVGERGASLSGGQKQRVAIARALLRNPSVLLLDEPTAALDPTAERLVQSALDAASVGRTTLVVSHRLSTIEKATRIIYMEQGCVLESGTHEELLAKQGAYWKLYQHDSKHRQPAIAEEVEDMVQSSAESTPFHRAQVGRHSTIRESFMRGSRRFGSVSSVQPPDVTETENELPSDSGPPVSAWALLRLHASEWKLLSLGGMASFAVGATMPVFALLFSKLYGMFSSSDPSLITSESQFYSTIFLLVAGACGALCFLQVYLYNRAGTKLVCATRVKLFRHYLYQEQAWFDEACNSVGALCARLTTDCAAIQGASGTQLGTVLQGISTMSIGVTLAMFYSWKMTLVSLLSVPCVIGGICLEGYMTRLSGTQAVCALEQAGHVVSEALANVRTVQALGVESTILSRYSSALDLASRSNSGRWLRGLSYGACLCAPTLGYAVSLAYGGYLIAREGLQYEYAILVSEALIYGAWMLAEALSFAPSFAAARRAGTRLGHTLARRSRIGGEEQSASERTEPIRGSVSFTDVHFNYPSRSNPGILRGVRARALPGQTVALVGKSGCGKSTLLRLVMRDYDVNKGSIQLDGTDIRSISPRSLRSCLGLVQQEAVLFSRSLRENIAYGASARNADLSDVINAARMANVHEFIASLPMGYETCLSSGGASLSGGQKQRVGIARALLRNPSVLLLDEPTSALDATSEQSVSEALRQASVGRTTLVIAHRLATVRHADVIYVIDQGVVAESGTHDELLLKRGIYYELWQQQTNLQ